MPPIVIASASNVPSISASPLISNVTASNSPATVTVELVTVEFGAIVK